MGGKHIMAYAAIIAINNLWVGLYALAGGIMVASLLYAWQISVKELQNVFAPLMLSVVLIGIGVVLHTSFVIGRAMMSQALTFTISHLFLMAGMILFIFPARELKRLSEEIGFKE
ncbi:hypothetical protein COT72_01335 [archaeon CG10_big_fil_rev_8_21_14_0_10_43_11]|nr:MAG: hypothetical protein COT72_01335 [archaeon CG10_big_fil_rev_8_21_14_0_10_43_11]